MKKGIHTLLLVLLLAPGAATAQQEGQAMTEREQAGTAFVDLLVAERFADAVALFDQTMTNAMPEAKLSETWQMLQAQVGAYQQRSEVWTEQSGAYEVVFVLTRFENVALDTKVVFDQAGKIAGLFFAPHQPRVKPGAPPYAKPEAYQEEEVVIGNDPQTALPGTLTRPVGTGPFPAVVLVHGSGPNDRDETIGPNKPFRDLAWGLASQGIAVLRYEKRTRAHPTQMAALENLTVKEESVDDALAAAAMLRSVAGIDPDRVYVLGHSLGGMLIPRIGARDASLAGLISLAGSARPLEELIVEQMTYITGLDGTVSAEEQAQLEQIKAGTAKIKALQPGATDRILNAPAAYWLDLRGYDPPAEAARLEHPMLILQGERDYQVTMADFERWKAALTGQPGVTLKSYPALNHLFIAGEGKSRPDEYQQAGHIAAEVVNDVAAWIKR